MHDSTSGTNSTRVAGLIAPGTQLFAPPACAHTTLGVVAAGRPDRAARALLERQPVPAIAAGRVGARDRIETPRLLTGLRVERDDVGAARRLAVHALHDFAARNERPAGQTEAAVRT